MRILDGGGTIDAEFFENGTSSVNVQVCFAAGTPVLLADGSTKPIENIEIGDRVKARKHDDLNSVTDDYRVVRVFKNVKDTWTVTFAAESGEEFPIRGTSEHPFYVTDKGWTPLGELKENDRCVSASGETIYVKSKRHHPEPMEVYNFEVENAHTYFVGENDELSVLVHNDCGICGASGFHLCTVNDSYHPDYHCLGDRHNVLLAARGKGSIWAGRLSKSGDFIFRYVDGHLYYLMTSNFEEDINAWYTKPTNVKFDTYFKNKGTLYAPPVSRTAPVVSKPKGPEKPPILEPIQGMAESAVPLPVNSLTETAIETFQTIYVGRERELRGLQSLLITKGYDEEIIQLYFWKLSGLYALTGRPWHINETNYDEIVNFMEKWQNDVAQKNFVND